MITSITHLWNLLDNGRTVYWCNDSYIVTIETAIPNNKYQASHFTRRGDKLLRVTCISNYFGSLLTENDLGNLYTK